MRIDEVQSHTPFEVTDYWSSDAALQQAVQRQWNKTSKANLWPEVSQRLAKCSQEIQFEARPAAQLLSRPNQAPRLVQFDEWGKRVDRVETSEGWRQLLDWQARHGIVGESFSSQGQEDILRSTAHSAGGRDRLGDAARLYNFTRTLMFTPDSHVATCPTSMTDGAARVLELYGTSTQKQRYLPKLLSRNYNDGWLAGQWMTEVAGGSDVSLTETVALPLLSNGQKAKAGDLFIVNGFKWFSSAVDGNMSLALARTDPDRSKGSKGLSLFLIPLHKKDRPVLPNGASFIDQTAPTSKYNGIRVHRLKNKLGTTYVPTAEIEICGALAELIGEEGRGVAQIASVLNITRIYSAAGNVSSMGRSLHIIQSYSSRRMVGVHGKPTLLKDIPLHNVLVAKVAITYRAILQLFCNLTRLLGKSEAGCASATDERRLRLLTPVLKAFGGVRASECIAQSIECIGGQGYMAENPLTSFLRDDFVSRIWEGTPSVLSLDVARVHGQTKGVALGEWLTDCRQDVQEARAQLQGGGSASSLGDEAIAKRLVDQTVNTLLDTINEIEAIFITEKALQSAATQDARLARPLLDLIAIVEGGVQLLNQCAWSTTTAKTTVQADPLLELHVAYRWTCAAEGGLLQARATLKALVQSQSQDGERCSGSAFDINVERHIAHLASDNLDLATLMRVAENQGAGLMHGTQRSLPAQQGVFSATSKL